MAQPPEEPVRSIALKSAPAGYRAPFPWRAAAVAATASVLGLSAALVLSGWGPEAARLARTLWGPAPAAAAAAPVPPAGVTRPALPPVSGVDSTTLVPRESARDQAPPRMTAADPVLEPRVAPPVSLQDAGADGSAAAVRSRPAPLRAVRGELDAPGAPADPHGR